MSSTSQPWLDAAAREQRAGEYPSHVAPSTVRVRIEQYRIGQYDGRQWRVLTTIEFAVPMGC